MKHFLRIDETTLVSMTAIASVCKQTPQNISDEDLAMIAVASSEPSTGKIDTVKMHENISKHKSISLYEVTLVNGQKFTADWKELPTCFEEVKE